MATDTAPPQGRARNGNTPGQVIALPFVSAAHEHTEPAFDLTVTPGASALQVGPLDIPAYGYARAVWIHVQASGGAGGTIGADFPWSMLSQVTLQDVGGQNIVGPIDGYSLWLLNVCLAPYIRADPSQAPGHVGTGPNPDFFVRVPIEIRPSDGLGALANQNASANMKLSFSIPPTTSFMSVDFTTAPDLRIRGYLEAWTLPASTDNRGRPQQQTPPMLGTGQVVSSRRESGIGIGNNTIQLKRVGNLLRSVLFVARDGSGVRDDDVFPDPVSFDWDGMNIHHTSQRYWQNFLTERVPQGFTRPEGVFALPFNTGGSGGRAGNEDPSGWLPTVHSSRLEVSGVSAAAGSIEVITVEVRPVETNQAERWQAPNDTNYQPPN